MNTYLRRGLIVIWVLFATDFLTRWLLNDPIVQETLPKSFWLFLIDLFGIRDAEAQVNLEILLGLFFSFSFVSLLTGLLLFLRRRFQSKNSVKKYHLEH